MRRSLIWSWFSLSLSLSHTHTHTHTHTHSLSLSLSRSLSLSLLLSLSLTHTHTLSLSLTLSHTHTHTHTYTHTHTHTLSLSLSLSLSDTHTHTHTLSLSLALSLSYSLSLTHTHTHTLSLSLSLSLLLTHTQIHSLSHSRYIDMIAYTRLDTHTISMETSCIDRIYFREVTLSVRTRKHKIPESRNKIWKSRWKLGVAMLELICNQYPAWLVREFSDLLVHVCEDEDDPLEGDTRLNTDWPNNRHIYGSFWMWCLHDEKWLRSCEELDSFSENRLLSFDQQATCNELLCKLHTIVLTVCTHVPKHLLFAQINKKFPSDENKRLIVQRSDLIVSKPNIILRIEPKQLRKTVNAKVWTCLSLLEQFTPDIKISITIGYPKVRAWKQYELSRLTRITFY